MVFAWSLVIRILSGDPFEYVEDAPAKTINASENPNKILLITDTASDSNAHAEITGLIQIARADAPIFLPALCARDSNAKQRFLSNNRAPRRSLHMKNLGHI